MNQENQSLKTSPISEQIQFLRRMIANPRNVGSIAPSGSRLSDTIAEQIDITGHGHVLELGPGSGSVTRAILRRGLSPERLTVIEQDTQFVKIITEQLKGVNVIHGDAFALEETLENRDLEPFAAIVSCLPLLNFPQDQRQKLISTALSLMNPGAPFIQYSYGLSKPATPPSGASVSLAAYVWKNLPPARVWVFSGK